MPVIRARRVHAFFGRLREPGAASVLLVGGLVTAAAVALPAAADPGANAVPAAANAANTSTSRPTSTSRAKSTSRSRTSSSSSGPKKYTCTTRPTYVSGTTATSITFHLASSSYCIYPGPSHASIDVYLTEDDAQNRTNKVGSTDASWGSDGTVTGLTPDTEYYWVASDQSGVRGPVRTTTPTSTTTSPPITACTISPVIVKEVGASWVSFSRPAVSECGDAGGFSVDVYAKKSDAQAGINPVGAASASGSGPAIVTGLKAGRRYYFVSSDRWSVVQGPVRTLTKETTFPTCTATYTIINSWTGGYVAEIAVAGSKTLPITRWHVVWTVPGGEAIDRAWGASVSVSEYSNDSTPSSSKGTGTRTVATAYNTPETVLDAGQATRFAFLGTSSGTPVVPELTCTGTR